MHSHRHTPEDVAAWERWERVDRLWSLSRRAGHLIDEAIRDVQAFAAAGPCYIGVSWGKDSVVVADIALRAVPSLPLAWVRVDPVANPDCPAVRDAFLARWPGARYYEYTVRCGVSGKGWEWAGTLEAGFSRAAEEHGGRYISGIRADESGTRKLRARRWGVATDRTCAPLSWWTGADVFGYLADRGLPVHPAYACTHGGLLPRERIRVASLLGRRGRGVGRLGWEETYYHDEVSAIVREAGHILGEM